METGHRAAPVPQGLSQPAHLLAVGLGFVGYKNGNHRIRCLDAGADGLVETVHESVAAADDVVSHLAVEGGDIGRKSDAAGHGVELGETNAAGGEDQIGPYH